MIGHDVDTDINAWMESLEDAAEKCLQNFKTMLKLCMEIFVTWSLLQLENIETFLSRHSLQGFTHSNMELKLT